MTNNETIGNNTIDIVSVRHKRLEDFSMVPTKPYEMLLDEGILQIEDDDKLLIEDITPYESEEIEFDTVFCPCNRCFFFIDNTDVYNFVLDNLELIRDIGFRIFKVDSDIALVINAYGLSYDHEYFLPLYELLVANGVVHL